MCAHRLQHTLAVKGAAALKVNSVIPGGTAFAMRIQQITQVCEAATYQPLCTAAVAPLPGHHVSLDWMAGTQHPD